MTLRNDAVSLSTFPGALDQFLIKNPYLSGDPNTLELADHFNHYFDAAIAIQNFTNSVVVPGVTTFTGTSTGEVATKLLSFFTVTASSISVTGDTYTFSTTVPSGFGASPFTDNRFSIGHTAFINSSSNLSGIWANKALDKTGFFNDMINWTQVYTLVRPGTGSSFDVILKFQRFYDVSTTTLTGGSLPSAAATVTDSAIGGYTQLTTNWQNTSNIYDGLPSTFGYAETPTASATGTADPGLYISRYLRLTGFTGGNLPLGSNKVVRGIKFKITRSIDETVAGGSSTQLPTNMSVIDYDVIMVKNGVLQSANRANPSSWSTTSGVSTTVTYGASGDLWGTTWSVADINNSSTGISIRCSFDTWVPGNGGTIHRLRANLDEVRMYVYTATLLNPTTPTASSTSTFSDSLSRTGLALNGATTTLFGTGTHISTTNWFGNQPSWMQSSKGSPFTVCGTNYHTFNPNVAQGNVLQLCSELQNQPTGGVLYAGDLSAAHEGPQEQQISFEITSWDCSGRFIGSDEYADRCGPMLRLTGSLTNSSFYGVMFGDEVGKVSAGGGYDSGGRYDKARFVKIENANLISWGGTGQWPKVIWDGEPTGTGGTRTTLGSLFTIKRKTDLNYNNDYSTLPTNDTVTYTFKVVNNTAGTQTNLYLWEKVGAGATTLIASATDSNPSTALLAGGKAGFFAVPLDNGQDRRYILKNPVITYFNTTSYSGSGGGGEVIPDPSPDPDEAGLITPSTAFGPFDLKLNLVYALLGDSNTLAATLT